MPGLRLQLPRKITTRKAYLINLNKHTPKKLIILFYCNIKAIFFDILKTSK